ncbi:MAG: histidine phosphatase family protein [Stagnimonas sp.]|nr:histidine phosphatase family protein [Stagnimonas sp.]
MKKSLAVLLVALLLPWCATHAMPDLVVLVRHAEKATAPADDPALSATGQQRAEALAQALEHASITAIITTQFRRTRDTAQPLAVRLHIEPLMVATRRGESAAHVPEVLAAIQKQNGNVLVVGHSNTVAQIAAALGGPALPDLCETTYGLALVLQPQVKDAALLRLRYGAADAASQAGCQ